MSTATATRIAYRAQLLLESSNSSAIECAKDALMALSNSQTGVDFPVSNAGMDAALWMQSAYRWVERGASHAFGFERPAEW